MRDNVRTHLINFLLISASFVALYFLLHRFSFLLIPIALALIVSEGIRGALGRIHPLSRGAGKALVILILLILCALVSLVAILFADRMIHLLRIVSEELTEHYDEIALFWREKALMVQTRLSTLLHRDMTSDFSANLSAFIASFLQKAAQKVPDWIGGVIAFVPRFFVSLFIFLFSTYYFSCDRTELFLWFQTKLPAPTVRRLLQIKGNFFILLKRYGKAYCLLFLLTFTQLLCGFMILGIGGAARIALLVALVDILPVLGTGTVLIPWALFSLFCGQSTRGISLLALYIIVLVIRQIAEPKIVGASIGLHPVLSLFLVIAGLYFFGFFGMIFLPLGVLCLFENSTQKEEKKA